MPNRIIRDSIRTSESLARLTPAEERHFYRLLVYADDYGRFDARPEVIRGSCYPLQAQAVSLSDVSEWLQRLASADISILLLYEVDGRPFGVFRNWEKYQRIRNARSKYPTPPSIDNSCEQLQANVAVVEDGDGVGIGVGNEIENEDGVEAASPPPPPREAAAAADDDVSEFSATFFSEWERNLFPSLVAVQRSILLAFVDEMPWLNATTAMVLIAKVANSDRRNFGFAESVLKSWQTNGRIDDDRQQGVHHGRADSRVRGTGANRISPDVAKLIEIQKEQQVGRDRAAG